MVPGLPRDLLLVPVDQNFVSVLFIVRSSSSRSLIWWNILSYCSAVCSSGRRCHEWHAIQPCPTVDAVLKRVNHSFCHIGLPVFVGVFPGSSCIINETIYWISTYIRVNIDSVDRLESSPTYDSSTGLDDSHYFLENIPIGIWLARNISWPETWKVDCSMKQLLWRHILERSRSRHNIGG